MTKATQELHWSPTPFDQALKDIVDFYDDVMRGDKYLVQRDEIVQVLLLIP